MMLQAMGGGRRKVAPFVPQPTLSGGGDPPAEASRPPAHTDRSLATAGGVQAPLPGLTCPDAHKRSSLKCHAFFLWDVLHSVSLGTLVRNVKKILLPNAFFLTSQGFLNSRTAKEHSERAKKYTETQCLNCEKSAERCEFFLV